MLSVVKKSINLMKKKMEYITKTPKDLLKMQTIMSEMKNMLELMADLNTAEEKIIEFEDREKRNYSKWNT